MIQQNAAERKDAVRTIDWRRGLPVLRDPNVMLRELRTSDASSLLLHFSNSSVRRYISAPPLSIDGFKQFILWSRNERRRGTRLCFGIVPKGHSTPLGIAQIWAIEPDFSTAEWGFVVGETAWGTGLFAASARLFLDFAFGNLGVKRLEIRVVEGNRRGNGALEKLGAIREGRLRCGFKCGDTFADHAMWSILANEWAAHRSHRKGAM